VPKAVDPAALVCRNVLWSTSQRMILITSILHSERAGMWRSTNNNANSVRETSVFVRGNHGRLCIIVRGANQAMKLLRTVSGKLLLETPWRLTAKPI
jgi:hypothetical protein